MARLVNGDYMEASNQLGTDLSGTVGSIQAWHRPAAITGEVICKAIGLSGGTQRFSYGLDYPAGTQTRFWIGNGGASATSATVTNNPVIGQWHHLVGVRRIAGTQELYIDGKLAVSVAAGTFVSTIDAFRFGQATDGDNPSNGIVRDAAIWKAELSRDEVIRLYQGLVRPGDVRPQMLQAWWPVYGGLSPEPDHSRFAAHATVSGPSPRPDESYDLPVTQIASRWYHSPLFIGVQATRYVQRA